MKLLRLNWDESFCPWICLEELKKERRGFWKYAHNDVQPNQGFFLYSTKKNCIKGIVAIGKVLRQPRYLDRSELEKFKLNYMKGLDFRKTRFIEIAIINMNLEHPLVDVNEISSYFGELGNFALQGSCALPDKVQPKAFSLYDRLINKARKDKFEKELESIEKALESTGSNTEIIKTVTQRVGQRWLREQLLSLHRSTCQISGITQPELLVCSHIIPWSVDKKNRLNPNNALLLAFNYDFLFDKGYISFDENGKILISKGLKGDFGINSGLTLQGASGETMDFLKYHRNYIFKK